MFTPLLIHHAQTMGTVIKQNPTPRGPYDFDVVTDNPTPPPTNSKEGAGDDEGGGCCMG